MNGSNTGVSPVDIVTLVKYKGEPRPGQRHDVWVTEFNFRSVSPARKGKLQKLLKLLKEPVIEVSSTDVSPVSDVAIG